MQPHVTIRRVAILGQGNAPVRYKGGDVCTGFAPEFVVHALADMIHLFRNAESQGEIFRLREKIKYGLFFIHDAYSGLSFMRVSLTRRLV
jgi:hypothetical protein